MKFRAVIREPHYMKELLNIAVTLSKLTKDCVMIITADQVHFIVNEESTSAAPLVWTEFNCSTLFDEYVMNGVDEEHPQILLSYNPANLSRALSALRNAVTFVKLKLTNQQFPCITVDIELVSNSAVQNRQIVHHVPVTIIPRRDWTSYKIPQIPDCQVVLNMPSLRLIRNLIDRIKNLSSSITLFVTSEGELSVVAETDSATIASHYRNLNVKNVNRENFDENIKDIEVGCLIDCKKTALFLSALQVPNVELTCGIIKDDFIHIQVEFRRGVVMNCFIPAVCV